jgi:hypothetical protein
MMAIFVSKVVGVCVNVVVQLAKKVVEETRNCSTFLHMQRDYMPKQDASGRGREVEQDS